MIPPALDVIARPVAALVTRYGAPASVATRDDGQHFTFRAPDGTLDATIDDDANVHAIEVTLPAGTPYALTVDGRVHRFTFGTTTSLAVRDELAADAETEGADYRTFRADARTFLAFFFAKDGRLTRVVAGDRGAFERMGLFPDPRPLQSRFPYLAPVLKHTDVADGSGAQAAVLRLDLDRTGVVKTVTVIIPSSDSAADAALAARLQRDAYAPAKLGGRPIAASVFREVRR